MARRCKSSDPAPQNGRLPPHSIEAEAGVIGCLLLSPKEVLPLCQRTLTDSGAFYDLRHRTIYEAACDIGAGLDLITLAHQLKEDGKLQAVGGLEYLAPLPDKVPSAANAAYYLDIVADSHRLRRLLQTCSNITESVYDGTGDVSEIVARASLSIRSVEQRTITDERPLRFSELLAYDVDNDPNTLLGLVDGRTTGYLCRGKGAWLIGPTGAGKSSLALLLAVSAAIGAPLWGIAPVKPLRVLVVQAENDRRDLAIVCHGLLDGLELDLNADKAALVERNLHVRTVSGVTGAAFCSTLRSYIEQTQADLVMVDPLTNYAGVDLNRTEQASLFLTNWLDGVLRDTGAAFIGVHHTGKPRFDRGFEPSLLERAYAGLGSSILGNWARAIMVLEPAGDRVFRLVLAKRGRQACATHPDGTPTTLLWLRQAPDRVWWEQVEPPEDDEFQASGPRAKGGRPSAVDDLLNLGLGQVVDSLSEPVSKGTLAEMIQRFARKRARDVTIFTAKRAVAKLLETGALKLTEDGLYLRS